MELNDILKVGEICEVSGRVVKAGVYSEKNTEYLNYNGTIVKNISIGSYVLIRKGFSNIIGRVEGEFMKEELSEPFKQLNKRNSVNRIVGIGILGALENDKFVHGVTNLPMIGNYVYVVTEDVISGIFSKNAKDKITLGTLIAYEEYPFEVNVQDLLCSHIGIFGNTGSGKSNTLAKLYREVVEKYKTNKNFNQNAKFVIIDFNGEYSKVFDNANIYKLSTRTRRNKNKYPISYEDIFDGEFWSIILEATDKTQKPFIDRCIRKYKNLIDGMDNYDRNSLCDIIYNSNEKIVDCRSYLKEIFYLLEIQEQFSPIEEKLMYNYKNKSFFLRNDVSDRYAPTKKEIFELAFGTEENENFNLENLNDFEKFKLVLYWNYCAEIGKAYITKEHIGPLMARANNRIDSLSKIFEVNNKEDEDKSNVDVISLVGLRVDMRKIIPLIICKKLYSNKKESKKNSLDSSLHIIVDEAHNILSNTSIRESSEWKDYRLECFEEIIKEGRKFGTFLTIASQRPSDISDTIISQLHNYFIHRLVNEEDLRKIYRTIAFSDKSTNEMIPILPAGGCVFAGLASNFPVLARISILPDENQPQSENIDIRKIWY
ncbi:MAG: ATP-binding protein [Lachnospira eligens]|jgi:DNA helicase HerA-like ATPase